MVDHLFEPPEHTPAERPPKPKRPPLGDPIRHGKAVANLIGEHHVTDTHRLHRALPALTLGEVEDLCRWLHHEGAIKWFGGDWYGVPGATTEEVNRAYWNLEAKREARRAG